MEYKVREAQPHEFQAIGALMIRVYAQLSGFPDENQQPQYYKMLANIGSFTENPGTKLLIAVSPDAAIAGAVVYFSDMKFYGSGGTATLEKHASGFRLLAVDLPYRGLGVGRLLTKACIQEAKNQGQHQIIIHSTQTMKIAWKMYENIGFKRSADLDFMQGELPVYGFRLLLGN